MSPKIPCTLVAALMACQSLALAVNASPNPAETDLVVGDGIGEFRPAGYDPAKTPSLALVAEPAPVATTGPAPLPEIRPSFGVEKGAQAVDPAVNFFPAAADLATAVVTAPAGTSFYGTGEVTGPLLRNNTTIRLWNKDNYNWQGDDGKRLYQSHPWVLAVRPDGSAFGVIFDTTWKSQLTCGDHDIKFESQGPPFRVFVIDRASPEAVLRGLAGLIGTIPLPPRWALGFQQCRYSYYPDARVRQIADGFRSRHIPCDVIWMDIDYMRGFRIFTFDPQGFPDPAATNQYLHEKGFHSIWMIDPGVKAEPGYSVYDSGTRENAWVKTADGKEYHGKVWPGECAFPDFTSPGVRAWWGGLYKDFMAKGVDGVWNDMNEPSVFGGPDGSMPESNLHAGGGLLPPGPHLEYHNVYGRLMVEASRAGIQKANPGKRVFVLTRSNFLGGQRYAATWTGDNNAGWYWLKSSIPMSLNLGLSGQPFSGPDIGGYSGVSSPDLFGQWMGLGAFYPFSRAHKSKGEPSSEPWEFGPAVEAASRTATDRRYRLMPYLYTLFRQSSQTGLPVMRPLFMADTKDLSLRGEDQAFTLGGDLLVIPRWAKNPHLPQGDWRAIHVVDPKAEEDAYQPTLRIRPGAIIPMGPIIENTNQYSLKLLTLLVSLDASGHAEGWLYDDAGDGFGFQKGDYSLIHYIATRTGETVTVKIADSQGSLPAEHANVTVQIVTGDYKTDTTQGDDARGIDCTLN